MDMSTRMDTKIDSPAWMAPATEARSGLGGWLARRTWGASEIAHVLTALVVVAANVAIVWFAHGVSGIGLAALVIANTTIVAGVGLVDLAHWLAHR